MKNTIYVTASEIGEYVYCQRAWWLRLQGLLNTTPAMRIGEQNHIKLSFWANVYTKILIVAVMSIILSVLLFIFGFLYFFR